ncbi:MAG: hypothetical protein ACFBZ8_07980 [Opitutales bacterium]
MKLLIVFCIIVTLAVSVAHMHHKTDFLSHYHLQAALVVFFGAVIACLGALWFRGLLLLALVVVLLWPTVQPPNVVDENEASNVYQVATVEVLEDMKDSSRLVEWAGNLKPELLIVCKRNTMALPYLENELRTAGFQSAFEAGYGICVFGKQPMRVTPVPAEAAFRAFAVKLQPDGAYINLVAVHLPEPTTSDRWDFRIAQLQQLADFLVTLDGETIVAGSFNCATDSMHFRNFVEAQPLQPVRTHWTSFDYSLSLLTPHAPLREPYLLTSGLSGVEIKHGIDLGFEGQPQILRVAKLQ